MDISNNDETEPQKKSEITLTKKQIKKKKKEERWEEIKKLKKLKMKEKKLLAKSIIDKKEPTQEISSEKPNLLVKQHRFNKTDKKEYRLAVQTSHPIIIDCSFQPLMTEKEIKSLCVQLAYCHSINRKFPIRSQIVITSFTDQIKQKLAKTNAENWGVSLQEKHYLEYYDKSKLIYLTGDAEEELNELEKDKIYIIGGLVDHNRLKLVTYKKAKEEGLSIKKFPIHAFLKLKTSTHLTVNHVFEILLRKMNGESWENSLKNTIPKRKIENSEEEKSQTNEEEKKE